MNVVLLAVEFVCDVVASHTIFKDVLNRAVLHCLCLGRWCTFNVVSQNCATEDAKRSRCCFAAAPTYLIAQHAACNRTHCSPSATFILLNGNLLLCANLARNRYLLDDLY